MNTVSNFIYVSASEDVNTDSSSKHVNGLDALPQTDKKGDDHFVTVTKIVEEVRRKLAWHRSLVFFLTV